MRIQSSPGSGRCMLRGSLDGDSPPRCHLFRVKPLITTGFRDCSGALSARVGDNLVWLTWAYWSRLPHLSGGYIRLVRGVLAAQSWEAVQLLELKPSPICRT